MMAGGFGGVGGRRMTAHDGRDLAWLQILYNLILTSLDMGDKRPPPHFQNSSKKLFHIDCE